ncbi:LysR family transcriptional regulator [Litoribacillus peritrichatus]|uniref:LysR substrate-binding domain-containing protein n=1 Tax=Litoribacillus peritrichatus TaxID=718191 RepID=A0ABP7MEI5_9GAMM
MNHWEGVTEFVAVAESESFTKASKTLGISTAQVSRQISNLEQRLATKLLYRTTRKVSVTEAGQIYYQRCRVLLDGLEEAENALTQLHQIPSGTIKLTAPAAYGETVIAPLLHDFLNIYPSLSLNTHLTNEKVDLTEGGYDLAIRLGKLENSSMIAKRLHSRVQFICASPEYAQQNGLPESLAELEEHNCLKGTLDYWRFTQNNQEKNIKVSGNIRCNSGHAILDATLKGIGISQLPDYYVNPFIKNGQLITSLETYQNRDEAVWALYPHNRQLSLKVKLLIEFLAEQLSAASGDSLY